MDFTGDVVPREHRLLCGDLFEYQCRIIGIAQIVFPCCKFGFLGQFRHIASRIHVVRGGSAMFARDRINPQLFKRAMINPDVMTMFCKMKILGFRPGRAHLTQSL